MVSQETIDEIERGNEKARFERFKDELVSICKRYGFTIGIGGDYYISIVNEDCTIIEKYIGGITPDGIASEDDFNYPC